MGYALRQGVTFCFVGRRTIFFDLIGNRFHCLGQSADRAFRSLVVEFPGHTADRRQLSKLVAAGLLVEADSDLACPQATTPALESKSQPAPTVKQSRLQLLLRALISLSAAKLRLSTRSLAQVVGEFRAHKLRRRARSKTATPSAVAQTYVELARYLRATDQCLVRSIALAWQLVQNGVDAEFVVGVQLDPFKTHAWVRANGSTLVDDPGEVEMFTPILVV